MQLTIRYDGVVVDVADEDGELDNLALCYAMLELAKDACREHYATHRVTRVPLPIPDIGTPMPEPIEPVTGLRP